MKSVLIKGLLCLVTIQILSAQSVPTTVPDIEPGTSYVNRNISPMLSEVPAVLVDPSAVQEDPWNFGLRHRAFDHKPTGGNLIDSIKAVKDVAKLDAILEGDSAREQSGGSSLMPVVADDFIGNLYNGFAPPDNSVAVSDQGVVVSATNSRLTFYTQTGTILQDFVLSSFFAPLNLTGFIYDPKVIYDPVEDKFILVALSGNTPSNTHVVIAFSTSNDPTQTWWLYDFNGDPGNTNTWFDFPSIGVSGTELYISGNSFTSANVFDQVTIFQIEKANGFTGGTVNFWYWTDVRDANNFRDFTVVPISFGFNGSIGPGIYFVSTDAGGGSTAMVYYTTDIGANSPSLVVNSVSVGSYSVPGNGFMLGTTEILNTNDCRTLSGFVADNIIHYVTNTADNSGFSRINYVRLDVSSIASNTITSSSNSFGLANFDYCFPSVAPFSQTTTDKSVAIGFLRTGSNIFPEFRVVTCDDQLNWSPSVQVRGGDDFINWDNTSENRWGDYTGISRRHLPSGIEVWISGCYGDDLNGGAFDTYGTWIARITDAASPTAPVADFFGVPTTVNIGDNVTFTDLSVNSPTSFLWDFGDGSTSSSQNPIHLYSAAGTYTVSLTASNTAGSDTETKSSYITVQSTVQAPVADFTANQTVISQGQSVQFTDLSINFPTTWNWNFGNGQTSTAMNPMMSYSTPGLYTVTLLVSNSAGSDTEVKTNYIQVVPVAPVCDFIANKLTVDVGEVVSFTDLSANQPTAWSWDFGDGSTSTQANPTQAYQNPGSYTVELTCANAGGADTETKTNYIQVNQVAPAIQADFTADKNAGGPGTVVIFSDLSTGSPTAWNWTFTGGTPSSAATQGPHTVIYSNPGVFDVSLTVTKGSASSSVQKSGYISIGTANIDKDLGVTGLTVAPNPVTDGRLTVTMEAFSHTEVRIKLIDLAGRSSHQLLDLMIKPGKTAISFNTDHLASGEYILVVEEPLTNRRVHEKISIRN